MVPKKYVEEVGVEGFVKKPIGAGPYKFVEYTADRLIMEAFEGYWRKTPSIKTITYFAIAEDATRLATLLKKELDIAYKMDGVLMEPVRKDPDLKLVAAFPPANFWLDFTEQWDAKSPWADIRVRRAASLAIDRDGINKAIYGGLSKPHGNFIPKAFEFSVDVPPDPYDPEKAKALLKEAGFAPGALKVKLTALPIGLISAVKVNSWWDGIGKVFALALDWLPVAGRGGSPT